MPKHPKPKRSAKLEVDKFPLHRSVYSRLWDELNDAYIRFHRLGYTEIADALLDTRVRLWEAWDLIQRTEGKEEWRFVVKEPT